MKVNYQEIQDAIYCTKNKGADPNELKQARKLLTLLIENWYDENLIFNDLVFLNNSNRRALKYLLQKVVVSNSLRFEVNKLADLPDSVSSFKRSLKILNEYNLIKEVTKGIIGKDIINYDVLIDSIPSRNIRNFKRLKNETTSSYSKSILDKN